MSDNGEPLQTTDAPQAQPGLKYLELAVYIMGGLLVLMFIALVVGIVWKVTHKPPPQVPTTQQLNLGLPAGAELKTTQVDGDRLIITTNTEIVVVDLKQNAILSRIGIAAK